MSNVNFIPSPHLRLRRLDLPGGALWVLLNAGEPVTSRLQLAPGCSLTRLTPVGKEPVATDSGLLEISLAGQNTEVFISK